MFAILSSPHPNYSYRKREDIQEVRKTRDPITGFKDKIVTANLVTEEELKAIPDYIRALNNGYRK